MVERGKIHSFYIVFTCGFQRRIEWMLYKFTNWNKNDHLKDNIKNRTLWFNTPEAFNDPFDIFANFQMNKQDRSQAHKFFEECGCDIQIVKEFSAQDILALQAIRDRSNIYNSKYGVTCFSRENNNILMWSHYADRHQGICLGFDIDETDIHLRNFMCESNRYKDNSLVYKLLPIEYGDDRPEFRLSGNNTEKLLQTKSTHWDYENETRIMVRSDKEIVFPKGLHYKSSCLKEIILGANMPLGDYLDLYGFKNANNLNIKSHIAELDKKIYRLNITPIIEAEESLLYKNISYLKNNIHQTVLKNEQWSGLERTEVESYWKKSIDKISLYSIKTYMPCFLQIDMAPEFEKDKITINEISSKVLIFLDMIQEQMRYEELADKIGKQQ